jgi:hypothetical protein
MTVEQHDVVDFVARNPDKKITALVISDHLSWDNVNEHLLCLQEKLNCYFRYVQSGELIEKYPDALNDKVAFEIVLEHSPPDAAFWFFEKARATTEAAGLALSWRVLEL